MDGMIVRVKGHDVHPFEAIANESLGTHSYTFATWGGMYCLFPEMTLKWKRIRFNSSQAKDCGFDQMWLDEFAYAPIAGSSAMVVEEYKADRRLNDCYTRSYRFTAGLTDDDSDFMHFGIRVHGQGEILMKYR
jgi:hypothetical protein